MDPGSWLKNLPSKPVALNLGTLDDGRRHLLLSQLGGGGWEGPTGVRCVEARGAATHCARHGTPPSKEPSGPGHCSRARCHRPAGQARLLPRRPHLRSLVCLSRFVHGPIPCIATSTLHSPLNSQPSGWRMINAQHTATHGQSTISDTPVLAFEKS